MYQIDTESCDIAHHQNEMNFDFASLTKIYKECSEKTVYFLNELMYQALSRVNDI